MKERLCALLPWPMYGYRPAVARIITYQPPVVIPRTMARRTGQERVDEPAERLYPLCGL